MRRTCDREGARLVLAAPSSTELPYVSIRIQIRASLSELYASLVSGVEIKRRPGVESHPGFRL